LYAQPNSAKKRKGGSNAPFLCILQPNKKILMKENENVGLPVYKVSDSEIYNNCPQLFKKVPPMQEEEKFRVGQSWWVPVRVRDGGKEDGTPFYVKSIGTFSIKLGYTLLDRESGNAYKICAFINTQEGRPVAIRKVFFGDENGMITLYKNNVEDQLAWYALMLAPFNKDNVLGLDNNGSPYLVEYVNEAAMINARASMIEQRRSAERALEQITDVEVLYALSQQLNPVAPYTGTKALQPLIVYLDAFVQNDPNKVVEAIQDLDALKIRQQIDDAITMGIMTRQDWAGTLPKAKPATRALLILRKTLMKSRKSRPWSTTCLEAKALQTS
jgi:hypothetical protein